MSAFTLAWVTDPHLNVVRLGNPGKSFGEYLSQESRFDAVTISGDISESHRVVEDLGDLAEGFNKPVYFVLGNHDFYGSSIKSTKKKVGRVANWLTQSGVIELTPDVALIGHDGWYDATLGDPYADFGLLDWDVIQEFRQKCRRYGKKGVVELSKYLAKQATLEVLKPLEEAVAKYPLTILVTHVPPFEGASWHEGRISSPDSKPWFVSSVLGGAILPLMKDNPGKKLLVLCGHTHHSAKYHALPNLLTLTGRAQYYAPELTGLVRLQDNHASIMMRTETGPTNIEF